MIKAKEIKTLLVGTCLTTLFLCSGAQAESRRGKIGLRQADGSEKQVSYELNFDRSGAWAAWGSPRVEVKGRILLPIPVSGQVDQIASCEFRVEKIEGTEDPANSPRPTHGSCLFSDPFDIRITGQLIRSRTEYSYKEDLKLSFELNDDGRKSVDLGQISTNIVGVYPK